MDGSSAITILFNPPHLYSGDIHFTVGIDDEKIAEGKAGETVKINIPEGRRKILILVENGSATSFSGTTEVEVRDGQSLKIRYGILSRTAKLTFRK